MENRETIKKVVRQFYDDVMNKGKIELIDQLVDKKFIEHEVIPGIEPTFEGVKEYVKAFRTAFPDIKAEIEDKIIEENKCVVRYRLTGTHKGNFMGISATNKKFDITGMDIVRFKDGKAIEHWGVTDMLKMLQQLEISSEQLATTAQY